MNWCPFSGGNTTFVLVYLPQIIGVSIALLLKLSRAGGHAGQSVHPGGLFGAVLFRGKADAFAGSGRWFTALVPMAMQQAGSLSPDSMINGRRRAADCANTPLDFAGGQDHCRQGALRWR